MKIITDISIRLVVAADDAQVPSSEIMVRGMPTGRFVSGAVLEAAVDCGRMYLLFLTDDVPFEEQLSIHLLTQDWELLDTAVLGSAYASGSFSSLTLTAPDSVHFRFIGDADWCVTVLPRPSRRLPFVPESPGVKRVFGFTRHFIVRGDPRPESSTTSRPGRRTGSG